MTIWIGLTGGIGSGKSQAAAYFKEFNVPIIDADKINYAITTTPNHLALKEIRLNFGEIALTEAGIMNRPYMRNLVFNLPHQRKLLEKILHPHIITEIKHQQQFFQAAYGIIELPTLTEHPHFQSLISRILLIDCSQTIRIERIKKRNQLNDELIQSILKSQASDQERRKIATDIISNETDLNNLKKLVEKMHYFYNNLYSIKK